MFTIYKVISGSQAYGTALKESDFDVRGVALASANCILGLDRFEQHVSPEGDTVIYDLRKFLRLALNNNPSILEILWVPEECVLEVNDYGRKLVAARQKFLSKKVYATFGGYAKNQLNKVLRRSGAGTHGVRREAIDEHGYDTKNAMHLIRLLKMGIEALREGALNVRRPDAAELLEIRKGKYSLGEIMQMAGRLEEELKRAFEASPLPEEPDYRAANELCVGILRDYLCKC